MPGRGVIDDSGRRLKTATVASGEGQRPTTVRYRVAAFGVSLAFIAYLDRACISQAAPLIMRDLGLTPLEMGYVFSAFGLTYAALEVPSGRLLDLYGPRAVLTRVVFCWSVFTMATGWAWNFASLVAARLLFGAGESGCFPGVAKSFQTWIPQKERPFAEGLKSTSARWGAAVAPPLVVALYASLGWRMSFVLFGLIGFIWAILFHRWYRDQPASHPAVNAAELALIEQTAGPQAEGGGWRAFIRSISAWALCLQWFCHFFGFYFYVTWLPTYLQQARGVTFKEGAWLASLPLFFAGLGTLFSGWLLSYLTERWHLGRSRKWMALAGYVGASALVLTFTSISEAWTAMVVLSCSSFIVELSTPVSWTTAMDLGGNNVGVLTGAMNTLGHLGGAVAPTLIAYLLKESGGNWMLAFYCSAALYAFGAVCWAVLDPVTRLE